MVEFNTGVVLTGNIVLGLVDDLYVFRDSTGGVIAIITPDVWKGLSVGVGDRVEIYGLKLGYSQITGGGH
jgi:uncharacterized protein (TIGR00156 family)